MKPLFALTATAFALAACGGGDGTTPLPLVAQPIDDSPFTVQEHLTALVPDPVVITVEPEPVAEPEPEPEPEPDDLIDSALLEINNPEAPMEPDRDNNGVAYINKPITEATYSLRYEFSTRAECSTALPCEPWIYTFIDFDLFWYDVEQGVHYRVWEDGQLRHLVTEAAQPPVHDGHRYTFALKLREPDVLTVVGQQTYQVDAVEFRGLSSGWTTPVVWTEVFR